MPLRPGAREERHDDAAEAAELANTPPDREARRDA